MARLTMFTQTNTQSISAEATGTAATARVNQAMDVRSRHVTLRSKWVSLVSPLHVGSHPGSALGAVFGRRDLSDFLSGFDVVLFFRKDRPQSEGEGVTRIPESKPPPALLYRYSSGGRPDLLPLGLADPEDCLKSVQRSRLSGAYDHRPTATRRRDAFVLPGPTPPPRTVH
eukprot:1930070-Prymnesium_polylepis.1